MMSFLRYLAHVVVRNKGLNNLFLNNHGRIYNEWKSQIESKKFPLDLELPWLTLLATHELEQYLKKKSKTDTRVFEYGSGGSTLFFLNYASRVVSVEHDAEWFNLVRKKVSEKNLQGWEGNLIEAEPMQPNSTDPLDVSNPHHYYSEDEKFTRHTFKNYASFISNYPDEHFDIVLVDGRSRPSCLFHSLKKVKKGGLLVLDNAERKYYLSGNIINGKEFKLLSSAMGAIVALNQFSQTNIYLKK